ncbi:MAG: monovalent cation/H(+) antiporter subunit G [Acidimicrobiaceae bacterium]|nr:monovalent cation/H(+) antiporter subunit G [Acidimicrobiaceae bacterium]
MIVQDVISDVLLGLSVVVVLASALGVMVMKDPYQKLHFVGPAALVAPLLVALAVLVVKGYYENTTETWLALLFMVMTGPYLAHATIRAARVRHKGDWRPGHGGKGP